MKIKICSLCDNITMKEFLKEKLLFSNGQIKKHLSNKELKRNIKYKDELELPIDLLNDGLVNPNFLGQDIEVIFEDDDLIVLNKPEGTHGHALSYSESNTVLNFLRKKFSFLGSRDVNKERGLLYRLDIGTSGVLIFSKDKKLSEALRENFKDVAISKKYLALVDGILEGEKSCTHFLAGSGNKGSKVIEDPAGRECHSVIKPIKEIDGKTLVEVDLKTGFRHQIRVQCSLIGHPIVGDELYGGSKNSRIFLHAYEYCLEINEEKRSFKAECKELTSL